MSTLKDIGFSDEELAKTWNGEASISMRDHRIQLLIRDATRYRQAQTAARTKVVRPVATVQRPGSPTSFGSQEDYNTRELSARLDRASGREALQIAAQLRQARRR